MTDEHLQRLLRSTLDPARGEQPSRDLWPLVVDRIEAPASWSTVDISLAVMLAIALVMFPRGLLLLLAYHL